MLEALHPGRIDLGIGRAPGTDGITASALRRSADAFGVEDFPTQLGELLAYAGDGFPAGHPYESVSAIPADAPLPPLWILGSSEYGAQVAAALGVGFAFARHLNPRGAEAIMRAYRDDVPALAGHGGADGDPDRLGDRRRDARARRRARDLHGPRPGADAAGPAHRPCRARRRPPRTGTRPTSRTRSAATAAPRCWATPAGVRDEILALADATAADEVMVMTSVHDHGERRRSYELIAEALAATAPAASGRTTGS